MENKNKDLPLLDENNIKLRLLEIANKYSVDETRLISLYNKLIILFNFG